MYAVGVDVSNGRSTVTVLRSKTKVVVRPFTVPHTGDGLVSLVETLNAFDDEEMKIVMEHTGRYYEPIAMFLYSAGFFVSAVNPLLIRKAADNNLHAVKTDPADAKKIARYALDNWDELRQYTPMDTTRYELKTLNRQFQLALKNHTALSNNLIALLDQTYPGIRAHFTSPARNDGSQKWVDYVASFWHADCVRSSSLAAFTERYNKWCKRHGYNFSVEKARELYTHAKSVIPLVMKNDTSRILVKEAVNQLNAVSRTVEAFRAEMNRLASFLPEYETVMRMTGVGKSLGPQLIAEIGDLTRFQNQKSLVAFAGTDPGKNDSGDKVSKHDRIGKRGSPNLRKALFMVMAVLLQTQPESDPVYLFLDKKRSEGKPYYVYMTAGCTKFLRIYFGKVRDCLKEKGLWREASLPTE